jgi:hypothetical protein
MLLLLALLLIVLALAALIIGVLGVLPLLAWVSVGVSAAAAVVLVVEARRHRRAARRAEDAVVAGADARLAAELDATANPSADVDADAEPVLVDRSAEPGEEDTDAADLLVVAELDVQVRVLDEHPRYHLARCPWVGDRTSLPLPLREARELGFTPCSVCTPDRKLAAYEREHRRGSVGPATE